MLYLSIVNGHDDINNKQSFLAFNYCTTRWTQVADEISQEDFINKINPLRVSFLIIRLLHYIII